jgi:hypothetical protein
LKFFFINPLVITKNIILNHLKYNRFASLAKVNNFIPVLILNKETNKIVYKLGDECYYFQTDCDQGCLEISRLLGWDKELLEMSNKTINSNDQ